MMTQTGMTKEIPFTITLVNSEPIRHFSFERSSSDLNGPGDSEEADDAVAIN